MSTMFTHIGVDIFSPTKISFEPLELRNVSHNI